jgi:P27 family predicted phage terminase small subunit
MAGKGPPRTPTSILEARGSKRAAERRAVEVALPPGCPTCPVEMGVAGRDCWDQVCATLVPVGALSEGDRLALGVLADTYQQWFDAKEVVRLKGATYEIEQGGQRLVVERPEAKRAKMLLPELRQWFAQFGFTPASRAGLSIPTGRPKPSVKKDAEPGGDVRRAVFGD